MKLKTVVLALTSWSVIVGSALIVGQPGSAQPNGPTFSCVTSGKYPTTNVTTRRGQSIPLIQWRSRYFEPTWTPLRRCQNVSQNFEQLYKKGQLRYLTIGLRDGGNVICTAAYQDGPCRDVLFTLTPGINPRLALQRMSIRSAQAGSGPLPESTERPYVNVEEQLLDIEPEDIQKDGGPALD